MNRSTWSTSSIYAQLTDTNAFDISNFIKKGWFFCPVQLLYDIMNKEEIVVNTLFFYEGALALGGYAV